MTLVSLFAMRLATEKKKTQQLGPLPSLVTVAHGEAIRHKAWPGNEDSESVFFSEEVVSVCIYVLTI